MAKFAFVEAMTSALASRRLWAMLVVAVALLASATRGLLPAGYMVNPGLHAGEIAVVLCTDHGRDTAALDLRTGAVRPLTGQPDPAPRNSSADPPCVFAAAAALAGPPQAAPSIAAPLAVAAVIDAPRQPVVQVGRGLAAPPPPPTGPPGPLA